MTKHIQTRSSRARLGLTKVALAMAGSLALLGSAPAAAAVMNFESQLPSALNGGDVIVENGFQLKVLDYAGPGGTSGAGGIGNSLDPNTCELAACPVGNNSLVYFGINDGSVEISRLGIWSTFTLRGFDFAFLAPIGNLAPGSYGQLLLSATTQAGAILSTALDLPPVNGDGKPTFGRSVLPADFLKETLTSLSMRACVNDGTSCIVPDDDSPFVNQAQFALDNIDLGEVPEPGTMALIGLGMGALALRRRKTAAAAAAAATINA
ncbi:NF038120 family PEP-CTERM protein [Massilia consociata]|uniref:NF038120 family PEP-CTERM protein n=1 Tax=Massilia consociata TaxID=760117 RepID=A0ABV6FJC1_9BURK